MINKFSIVLFLLLMSCVSNKIIINKDISLVINNKDIILNNKGKFYKLKTNLKLSKNFDYVINKNDLFIISFNKSIIKISLENNKVVWTKTLSTIPQNNLVFDDNSIYFNGIDNNFYILNYKNGNIENIIFNTNINTVKNTRKPYLYKNKIVVFFNNKEIYIVENKNKIIKNIFYKYSVNIEYDKIIIDNKEVIKL